MLIDQRVKECYDIFGKMFTINDDTVVDLGQGLMLPISGLVPLLMSQLCEATLKKPETAEGILNWLSDAILYAKGEIDDMPLVDMGDLQYADQKAGLTKK